MIIGLLIYLILGAGCAWYTFDEDYERGPDHPAWVDLGILIILWPVIVGIATYKIIFGNWEDI